MMIQKLCFLLTRQGNDDIGAEESGTTFEGINGSKTLGIRLESGDRSWFNISLNLKQKQHVSQGKEHLQG